MPNACDPSSSASPPGSCARGARRSCGLAPVPTRPCSGVCTTPSGPSPPRRSHHRRPELHQQRCPGFKSPASARPALRGDLINATREPRPCPRDGLLILDRTPQGQLQDSNRTHGRLWRCPQGSPGRLPRFLSQSHHAVIIGGYGPDLVIGLGPPPPAALGRVLKAA